LRWVNSSWSEFDVRIHFVHRIFFHAVTVYDYPDAVRGFLEVKMTVCFFPFRYLFSSGRLRASRSPTITVVVKLKKFLDGRYVLLLLSLSSSPLLLSFFSFLRLVSSSTLLLSLSFPSSGISSFFSCLYPLPLFSCLYPFLLLVSLSSFLRLVTSKGHQRSVFLFLLLVGVVIVMKDVSRSSRLSRVALVAG
jgi:hypothetical protein